MKYTVTLIVLICLASISCGGENGEILPAETPEPLKFAVFGNSGLALDDGAVFAEMLKHLDTISPDFAVDLGNRLPPGLSSGGIAALLDTVDKDREALSCPLYVLAGQNDVFDYDSEMAFIDRYGPQWYAFSRKGSSFIFLSSEDSAWDHGFGTRPFMSTEQLAWLEQYLAANRSANTVVFMHRAVWRENPILWKSELKPLFDRGGVDLIIASSADGLMDYGSPDGIRTITTGCTGPVSHASAGNFPHMLTVTVGDGNPRFEVISADGGRKEGIPVDSELLEDTAKIVQAIKPRPFAADKGWNISESLSINIENPFDEPVSGRLEFALFKDTSWSIEPADLGFIVEPGMKSSYRIAVKAKSPELAPLPVITGELNKGATKVYAFEEECTVAIPPQRIGDPVPVEAHIADVIPYGFSGKLAIPVEIDTYDLCGRCVIYCRDSAGRQKCIHIASLKNFRPGINEFSWNGLDLEGRKVSADSLSYSVIVYNKRAPATWVAEGPPNHGGTAIVEDTLKGLSVLTHDGSDLKRFRIGGSLGKPSAETEASFESMLDGGELTGFVRTDDKRFLLGTAAGILAVNMNSSGPVRDLSFGSDGYLRFESRRGRKASAPTAYGDMLAVAFAGNNGNGTELVIYDALTGKEKTVIDLGVFFGDISGTPAVTALPDGILCGHPDHGLIVKLGWDGSIVWSSDPDSRTVAVDSDGRSYTFGIGCDSYGFSYVNTPGYSARSVVIGPDGIELFRVILVSLPGLRVSSVTPHVTGESSDGLYFVTRGGDCPYIFHVPYTIRQGLIVDESGYVE